MSRSRTASPTRRLIVATICAAAVAAPGTPSAASEASPSAAPASAAAVVTAKRVVGGLHEPTAFTFGPGNKIWYVEKSTGEIRVYDRRTRSNHLFYEVSGVNAEGERGMLGIALHPDFPTTPYVYVYVTRSAGGSLQNQIVRVTDSSGKGTSPKVLFATPAASSPYHNGGRILFGPDRMLYAIVGDAHDSRNSQQVSRNPRGKILRIDPAGAAPPDNPFPDNRVFAYGIRNSFGFAFDPRNGSLWETENGPECNDELNLILAGENYGWGPHESCTGTAPGDTNRDGPSPRLPKLWYTPTIAPTGIAFCQGCGLGAASEGALFFGAYNTAEIRRVVLNGARDDVVSQSVVYTHSQGVLSMEVGPDHAIYFSDFGAIYRLALA